MPVTPSSHLNSLNLFLHMLCVSKNQMRANRSALWKAVEMYTCRGFQVSLGVKGPLGKSAMLDSSVVGGRVLGARSPYLSTPHLREPTFPA